MKYIILFWLLAVSAFSQPVNGPFSIAVPSSAYPTTPATIPLDATVPYSIYQIGSSFAWTTFANLNPASQYSFSVVVSNSANATIVVTSPAQYMLMGASSSATLNIPAGKEGIFSFWIRPNNRTNMCNVVQQ